ncbi:MAG: ribosome-associated translation inhibitor RaiA [Clostridia bacterium]
MILDLTGLRIEVTDAIKEFVQKKINKLEKFFEDGTICHVTFAAPVKGKQHIDMRIEYKSRTYIAEEETEDLYSAVEELVSKIERQLSKDKSANVDKKRKEGIPSKSEIEDVETILDEE